MDTAEREVTVVEKMRKLPWSVGFSVMNSIYVQYFFFGSIFILFLNELGLDKAQIGGLLSLLPFFGLIALFVAPALARFGNKRSLILSFTARTAVSGLLVFTPWVLKNLGTSAGLAFTVAIVAGFAVTRAIGLTAWYPWEQEYVPGTVRGKITALKSSLSSLAGFVAVTVGGYVIGSGSGLDPFIILFAAGLVFGFLGVWCMSFLPGGAPVRLETKEQPFRHQMAAAVRDTNFVGFMIGGALIALATTPLGSFLPLFMKEQVGLSAGNVVLLQNGTLLGGLLSSYLWGWAADRYGSKPVMLLGVMLMGVLPVFWLFMPRNTPASVYIALAIAFVQGLVNTSWTIASARMLYVGVVPAERSTEYMAVYYAWNGIIGGVSQLIGGWILSLFANLDGHWWIMTLDPYTPLLLLGLVLPFLAVLFFRPLSTEGVVSTGEFALMFFRGNPLLAMGSLIGFHRAKSERATVSMTERLGQARSPLAVDELLEALSDPRFFVRFEAIVSIARGGSDPRLMDALIEVLHGHDPALSVIAAWGLGRMGDQRAIEPLRAGLNAPYRSVQAHCARSLGTLGDLEVMPLLLERLASERDTGLRIAYASALGHLGAQDAAGDILTLLEAAHDPSARHELALAVARLIGDEHHSVQLFRQLQSDAGTAAAQALAALSGRLREPLAGDMGDLLGESTDAFAREELEQGCALLSEFIGWLEEPDPATACDQVLHAAGQQLAAAAPVRLEYLLLALHALECRLG